MSDIEGQRFEESGTIEVRVRRHGVIIHEERCESAEQVATVVDAWGDFECAEVEVVDLLRGDRVDDIIEMADDDAFPGVEDTEHHHAG